jgi:cytochrome c-type biogenesis protein CcmH
MLFALCLACTLIFPSVRTNAADDAALDERVKQVASQLRCLVCQNQTIADSDAELALDLRRQVREKLVQGATEQEVREFMVKRYGDFVLYDPPLKGTTWLLWFGPLVLLAAGLGLFAVQLQRRKLNEGIEP